MAYSDTYVPAPVEANLTAPDGLETVHVQHDNEVWTEEGRFICSAVNYATALLIVKALREAGSRSDV